MAKKKKKLNKEMILGLIVGLLIVLVIASQRLTREQSLTTSSRATEGQSCISQVYTYHGRGICIDHIKLVCRDMAFPNRGINCKKDDLDPKTVTCDFSKYNGQALRCVNPTTLKTMLHDICGCPNTTPIPLPTKGRIILDPPGQPY